MTSLYCIRDAGGVRRYRTYPSREAAERQIEAEAGPGCRAPFDVVEFVEVSPVPHKQITADVADAMTTFGGSFVKALARAWYCADAANRARLERAFAPEFLRYAVMAELLGSVAP